jgi:hypothetical protein
MPKVYGAFYVPDYNEQLLALASTREKALQALVDRFTYSLSDTSEEVESRIQVYNGEVKELEVL